MALPVVAAAGGGAQPVAAHPGLAAITLVLLVSTQLDRALSVTWKALTWWWAPRAARCSSSWRGVPHRRAHGQHPLQEVALQQNPLVAQVVPLSLGDSYQGYRIVGTTPDYVAHYRATLAEGTLWQQPMDAVLGASAARGIVKPDHAGKPLVGPPSSAAMGWAGGHAHGDHPYRVSGVLAPCGCVLTGSSSPAPNRSGRCTKPPRPTTPKTWKS